MNGAARSGVRGSPCGGLTRARACLTALALGVFGAASSVAAAESDDVAASPEAAAVTAEDASGDRNANRGLVRDSQGDTARAAARPVLPVFLLPAEGDVFHAREVKVVIKASPAPRGLLAVLDGLPLENPVEVNGDVLTVALQGLNEGVHGVRLLYLDDADRLRATPVVRFFVRLPEPPPPPAAPPPPPRLKQFGRVTARGEWRNDEAASRIYGLAPVRGLGTVPETDSTWGYDTLVVGREEKPPRNLVGAAEVRYGARYERWEVDVTAAMSSQENRFRQPVNRLTTSVAYGPWAFVRVGDVQPDYNPLIFNGTILRGMEAGVTAAVDGGERRWAYARVASGESQKMIPAHVVRSYRGGAWDTAYVAGTYAQNVSAFRLGAGGGEVFDAGFTLMKSREARRDSAAESVQEYLYGASPDENLVGGIDARMGFWDGRLQAYGRAALSVYTRDRTLGDFSLDSADGFPAGRYRRILTINPTTNGWEYFVTDGGSPDYKGFLDAASAYTAGLSLSTPWRAVSWETDIVYEHLGADYRSEGNPFLGGSPGDGWTLQQRLGFLENRLHLGAELATFSQAYVGYLQRERAVKTEARFATPDDASSVWAGAGVTRQAPEGGVTEGYFQDFDELNFGGTHRRAVPAGTWTVFGQYGFTRGAFRLRDPDPLVPVYPVSLTHVLNSSLVFNVRDSEFTPKASHTYSDNGIQKPVHTFGVGARHAWRDRTVVLDANLLGGGYARSATENGLGFAQNCALTLRFRDHQSVRITERSSHYGPRVSVIAGGHYERSF